jgi:hypothetical protein
LTRLAAETGAYYWLGFTQAAPANFEGQRRELRLEMKENLSDPRTRRGWTVRARNSFLPVSRETRLALELESALLTRLHVARRRDDARWIKQASVKGK